MVFSLLISELGIMTRDCQ
jgi:septal ring factor EnvC (AmiA/AmiB activator)